MSGDAPGAGEPAPDFTLPDTHGTPVHLGDLRGENVLVVFFPFAFSGTCGGELRELRDNLGEFESADVRVLAVSTDPVFALKAWQESEGFGFDLLSDFWPHGTAAKNFGVFDEGSGHALRGSFLLDTDGIVRWSVVHPRGLRRELDGYLQAIAGI